MDALRQKSFRNNAITPERKNMSRIQLVERQEQYVVEFHHGQKSSIYDKNSSNVYTLDKFYNNKKSFFFIGKNKPPMDQEHCKNPLVFSGENQNSTRAHIQSKIAWTS